MTNSRRAEVLAMYQGVNITSAIQDDLLSFSYTDNASGASDSVSLSLKDHKRKWVSEWFPEKGDMLIPTIVTNNWRREGDRQQLNCGRFYIDNPSYSGRPSSFDLNGTSSPLNRNFKDVKKSKTWRNITLFSIAGDIANEAGLKLETFVSGAGENPRYPSIEQSETSDAEFLAELCENEGLAMKVTDSKIIIFDERVFESRASVKSISEANQNTLSYSFESSLSDTAYAGVKVSYFDVKIGRNIDFLYSLNDIDEDSKIYKLNKRVNSGSEARRLAQKTLRRLNKVETTGSLTVTGDVELLGGVCVDLTGFGAFDGKYYITSADHSIGSGYTTSIDVRKVLEGY